MILKIFKKRIFLEEPTEVNIESQIESLFPLLEDTFVSYKKYISNLDLHNYAFKNYFEFYKTYQNIFSFISPKLIGITFFDLEETTEDSYWNYDMFKMVSKAKKIIDETSEKIPIYELLAISLISSKPVPSFIEEKKTEEEIKPIEGEQPSEEQPSEAIFEVNHLNTISIEQYGEEQILQKQYGEEQYPPKEQYGEQYGEEQYPPDTISFRRRTIFSIEQYPPGQTISSRRTILSRRKILH